MRRGSLLTGALLGVAALSASGPVEAQEYCVSCAEPDALYRCIIEGARPGGGSLQMLCAATIAKEGGHARCSVKGGTVFECTGAVKRIPWSAVPPQASENSGREAAALPSSQPNPADKPKPDTEEPPQTMLELAKRANEKTAEQMRKAGENMKDATKKTWDCMLSFFTRC
jgi:hypothetical protein